MRDVHNDISLEEGRRPCSKAAIKSFAISNEAGNRAGSWGYICRPGGTVLMETLIFLHQADWIRISQTVDPSSVIIISNTPDAEVDPSVECED